MPASERKFWPPMKKHIHVLGEVRQVVHGSGTIGALYLYEASVCRGKEPSELPPARIDSIIGASNGIRCTVCGELVDWGEAPAEAYQRLMGHYDAHGAE